MDSKPRSSAGVSLDTELLVSRFFAGSCILKRQRGRFVIESPKEGGCCFDVTEWEANHGKEVARPRLRQGRVGQWLHHRLRIHTTDLL